MGSLKNETSANSAKVSSCSPRSERRRWDGVRSAIEGRRNDG